MKNIDYIDFRTIKLIVNCQFFYWVVVWHFFIIINKLRLVTLIYTNRSLKSCHNLYTFHFIMYTQYKFIHYVLLIYYINTYYETEFINCLLFY